MENKIPHNSQGAGKKAIKKNEANLPVKKSIRIRKEAQAPTEKDWK